MKSGLVLALPVIFCLHTLVHRETYKGTDEQGRVHFRDKPPGENAA